MSFLFYLKVKKIVLMIFSPILNVIDPKLRVLFVFDKLLSLKKLGYNTLVNLFKGEI